MSVPPTRRRLGLEVKGRDGRESLKLEHSRIRLNF